MRKQDILIRYVSTPFFLLAAKRPVIRIIQPNATQKNVRDVLNESNQNQIGAHANHISKKSSMTP